VRVCAEENGDFKQNLRPGTRQEMEGEIAPDYTVGRVVRISLAGEVIARCQMSLMVVTALISGLFP